ncbi:hypothetical protein GA0061078_0090 [Bifidobacterium bohemicum]|uniref:Uncharacterized protein n=1 Tax=Bifidobacterium bohemicum DSM 22767 TaxID=1437606 RepID=A0A086ZFJ8_9BIFI|nr:hypothetical protein BBOH_1661 [Bifidobacterium bohemicum DSM 22767]SCC19995.1 hypothetical protein GA0061078_0090 [Bifidobacterium bohemicum]
MDDFPCRNGRQQLNKTHSSAFFSSRSKIHCFNTVGSSGRPSSFWSLWKPTPSLGRPLPSKAYSHRSTNTLLTPYSRGSMPYRCVHDVPHRHRCTRPALAWAGLRIGRIQPTDEFVTGRFPTVSLLPQANIPLETRSTARCISALLYKYQTLYPDFNFLSAPRDAARSAPRTLSPVPSTRSRSISTSPTCRPC